MMTWGNLASWVRRRESFSWNSGLKTFWSSPLEVIFLIVVVSDWLLSGGGMMLGSRCACEEKEEPNRSFVWSVLVLGMGTKVSFNESQMFLSSLGLALWQLEQMR